MSKYAKKKDDNHNEIVSELKSHGLFVIDTYRYDGLGWDVMAKMPGYHSPIYCIEIKDGAKAQSQQKLTKSEILASQVLGEFYVIIRSIDDVKKFVERVIPYEDARRNRFHDSERTENPLLEHNKTSK